jgi:hypothetical protein
VIARGPTRRLLPLALLAGLLAAAPAARAQGSDLPYADYHHNLLYDWYVPTAPGSPQGGPHPVVVFVHGGGVGDKLDALPAPDNMTELLLGNGFTVLAINYRPFPEFIYPAQLEDVATAVQYFREHAAELDIDPARLAIWGISAGAIIGGWLAYGPDLAQPGGTPQQQQSTRPQVLLNESGLTNFLLMNPSWPSPFAGGTTLGELDPAFLQSVSFSEMVLDVPRAFTPPCASFYGQNENPPPVTDPHDVTMMLDLHENLQQGFPEVAAVSQMLRQYSGVQDNYYEQRVAWLLLRLGVGHQLDLGKSLAGTGGAPTLSATGDWLPGGQVSISFQAATPAVANVWLVAAKTAVKLPFKGGTLVPAPAILFALQTDAGGAFSLAGFLPPQLPLNGDIYLQAWVPDPGAPAGFAGSNAVVGILVP